MSDREGLISKANVTTAELASGGRLTKKQAEQFNKLWLSHYKELMLGPKHGPVHWTGPPCAGCGYPSGPTRYNHLGKLYCSRECRAIVVLREERDQLYLDENAASRELGQLMWGGTQGRYDVNRALWSIAFQPLWEQEVFDFNYGAFENDVFIVRPYFWGDCKCEGDGACTCEANLPNFEYKPVSFKLHWYKYPLRGATVNQRIANYEVLCEMVQHCITSLDSTATSARRSP